MPVSQVGQVFTITGSENFHSIWNHPSGPSFLSRTITNVLDTIVITRYQMTNPFTITVSSGATFTIPVGTQITLLNNTSFTWITNAGTVVFFEPLSGGEGLIPSPGYSFISGGQVSGTWSTGMTNGLVWNTNPSASFSMRGGALYLRDWFGTAENGSYTFEDCDFVFGKDYVFTGDPQWWNTNANLAVRRCRIFGMIGVTFNRFPQAFDAELIGIRGLLNFNGLSETTMVIQNIGSGRSVRAHVVLFNLLNPTRIGTTSSKGMVGSPDDIKILSHNNDDPQARGLAQVVQPIVFDFNFADTRTYLVSQSNPAWASNYRNGRQHTLTEGQEIDLLTYVWDSGNNGNDRTNMVNNRVINYYAFQPYQQRIRSFGGLEINTTLSVRERYDGTPKTIEIQQLVDPFVTGNKATADAQTGHTFNSGTQTWTWSATHTAQQRYNRLKSYLLDNMAVASFGTYNGSELSLSWNIVVANVAAIGAGRYRITNRVSLSQPGDYSASSYTIANGARAIVAGGSTNLSGWTFESGAIVDNSSASAATVTVAAGQESNITIASPTAGGGTITLQSPNPIINISGFSDGSKITIVFGGGPIDVATTNSPYSFEFALPTPATVTVQVEKSGFESFRQDIPIVNSDVSVFVSMRALTDADAIKSPDVNFRKRFAEDSAVLAILRAADTNATLREYVGRAMVFDFDVLAWKDSWNAIVGAIAGTTPTLTDVNRWRSYATETEYTIVFANNGEVV